MIEHRQKVVITTLVGACIAGIVFFLFFNDWIIIRFPFTSFKGIEKSSGSTLSKRITPLFVPDKTGTAFKSEQREILWSSNAVETVKFVTEAWLAMLAEEGFVQKRVILQSVAEGLTPDLVILSFDRPPFNTDASTTEKWAIIESLLATLRSSAPEIAKITFLCKQVPLEDYHLDFSLPWPITGFWDAKASAPSGAGQQVTNSPFVIVIDPAGDAVRTGRVIGEEFERGLTLQFAESLKKELESQLSNVKVYITRTPGAAAEPLQHAAFANVLNANLFFSIHFTPVESGALACSLFYFTYDPLFAGQEALRTLDLTPYQEVYKPVFTASVAYAQTLQTTLQPYHTDGVFKVSDIHGFPFKPLIGVQAPAIGCEIGLHEKDGWKLFVKPVANGIINLVRYARQTI